MKMEWMTMVWVYKCMYMFVCVLVYVCAREEGVQNVLVATRGNKLSQSRGGRRPSVDSEWKRGGGEVGV